MYRSQCVAVPAASETDTLYLHDALPSYGAARAPQPESRNALQEWMNNKRRTVLWEKEGRESSVAVVASSDLAFVVNGKIDGRSEEHSSELQSPCNLVFRLQLVNNYYVYL